jgi:hypothetical protein
VSKDPWTNGHAARHSGARSTYPVTKTEPTAIFSVQSFQIGMLGTTERRESEKYIFSITVFKMVDQQTAIVVFGSDRRKNYTAKWFRNLTCAAICSPPLLANSCKAGNMSYSETKCWPTGMKVRQIIKNGLYSSVEDSFDV